MEAVTNGRAEPDETTSTRTSTHTSAPSRQRVELITRTERRRRWSVEQKRAIVAESYAPEASALATARKYAISSGQLYLWRSQLRRSEPVDSATSRFVRLGPTLNLIPLLRGTAMSPPPPIPSPDKIPEVDIEFIIGHDLRAAKDILMGMCLAVPLWTIIAFFLAAPGIKRPFS